MCEMGAAQCRLSCCKSRNIMNLQSHPGVHHRFRTQRSLWSSSFLEVRTRSRKYEVRPPEDPVGYTRDGSSNRSRRRSGFDLDTTQSSFFGGYTVHPFGAHPGIVVPSTVPSLPEFLDSILFEKKHILVANERFGCVLANPLRQRAPGAVICLAQASSRRRGDLQAPQGDGGEARASGHVRDHGRLTQRVCCFFFFFFFFWGGGGGKLRWSL